MSRKVGKAVLFGCVAAGLAAGYATAAIAQQSTPKSWNYEIRDGKRVPKSERQTKADGSWREEVRQGNCVTIKERTASGEYRETRRCD